MEHPIMVAFVKACIEFWIWANTNAIDRYDPSHPLMSPFQIVMLLVGVIVAVCILFPLTMEFFAWQERRWVRELNAHFAAQKAAQQSTIIKE